MPLTTTGVSVKIRTKYTQNESSAIPPSQVGQYTACVCRQHKANSLFRTHTDIQLQNAKNRRVGGLQTTRVVFTCWQRGRQYYTYVQNKSGNIFMAQKFCSVDPTPFIHSKPEYKSRDSSVGIVAGLQTDDPGVSNCRSVNGSQCLHVHDKAVLATRRLAGRHSVMSQETWISNDTAVSTSNVALLNRIRIHSVNRELSI